MHRKRRFSDDDVMDTSASEDSVDLKTIVLKPNIHYDPLSTNHGNNYKVVQHKDGDVEREKAVELRIRSLGLWDSKRAIEEQVKFRLHERIEQDELFKAINLSRRKRPLRERVARCAERITELIRSSVVTDISGHRIKYQVHIMMGLFTRNVTYEVLGSAVVVRGHSIKENGFSLEKEIRIDFPPDVETSHMRASFMAGVFFCEAPFAKRRLERSRSSGSMSSAVSQYSSLSEDRSMCL